MEHLQKQEWEEVINTSEITSHISGRKLIKIHSKEDIYDENEYIYLDEWINNRIENAVYQQK